eukprot:jgi/Mesvir1/2864/Mv13948-RA.2
MNTCVDVAWLQSHGFEILSGNNPMAGGLTMNPTAAEARPAPGGGKGTLTVRDNRTGKTYEIPINEGGTIKAMDLKQIVAGGDGVGLRTYDPGYMNTSAVRSSISYIDGDKGILRYRGYPIEQLAQKSSFLETAFLLIYGSLPTAAQLSHFEDTVMRHSAVPSEVEDAIAAMPPESHPMALMVQGLAALSAMHPDANPATGEWLRDYAPVDKRTVTPGAEEMAAIPPSNAARRRLAAKAKL